jgi:hypothetical protein
MTALCVLCGCPTAYEACDECNAFIIGANAAMLETSALNYLALLDRARRLRPWVSAEERERIASTVAPRMAQPRPAAMEASTAPEAMTSRQARTSRPRPSEQNAPRNADHYRYGNDWWWGACWEADHTVATSSILAAVADRFRLEESGT